MKEDKGTEKQSSQQLFVKAAGLSAAGRLGFVHGCEASLPTDAEFTKAAAERGLDPQAVKQAYLKKQAGWKTLLGLLGAGYLGGKLINGSGGGISDAARNYSWAPYNTADVGGLSPNNLSRYAELAQQEGLRVRQNKQLMQQLNDAYNPPYGAPTHSPYGQ